ncbi:hypothetical protein D3C72_1706100 [compost metagenome]
MISLFGENWIVFGGAFVAMLFLPPGETHATCESENLRPPRSAGRLLLSCAGVRRRARLERARRGQCAQRGRHAARRGPDGGHRRGTQRAGGIQDPGAGVEKHFAARRRCGRLPALPRSVRRQRRADTQGIEKPAIDDGFAGARHGARGAGAAGARRAGRELPGGPAKIRWRARRQRPRGRCAGQGHGS